jgi:hypothetical protein
MYLVTEFVIYPKKSAVAKGIIKAKVDAITPALAVPNISASTESRSGTPISGSSTPLTNAEEVKKAAGFYRARSPREDGGVVCCLAMTEYCFKQGRVTVPPVSSHATCVTILIEPIVSGSAYFSVSSGRIRLVTKTYETSY